MTRALRRHWPEYLMEAAELGTFMIAACVVVTVLQHPASPLRDALPDPVLRRVLTGLAMGVTAIAIIHTPWGKRSGAHFNPSVTLTYLRLGKVQAWDAAFYVAAQFAGGVAGVLIAAAGLGSLVADPHVRFAATLPGPAGVGTAFAAEAAISFVLMTVVLFSSNSVRLARWTPFFAGALVATWISLEAPLSGMSMNPARTFGSALPLRLWTGLWLYFLAPPLGMLAAAEVYLRLQGARQVRCAKLHHHNTQPCIFHCGYGERS
jgi:aquaporin Z